MRMIISTPAREVRLDITEETPRAGSRRFRVSGDLQANLWLGPSPGYLTVQEVGEMRATRALWLRIAHNLGTYLCIPGFAEYVMPGEVRA